MLRVMVLFVVVFVHTILCGQISQSLKQQITNVSELQVQSMPLLNNASLLSQELSERNSIARPPKFAFPIEVNYNVRNSGVWETIGEQSVWRLVLESKGAHSLNLGFSEFKLPSSASLYIYDFYGEEQLRPFVAADNEVHEQLWAPIISSDKVVIEVNVDTAEKDDLLLSLNYVNHDFANIEKSISDACHIDVQCGANTGYPDIDIYRDQIRSIGLYTIEGVSICTGFLINNTRQDCRPYFMTADHCNLNAGNAASMVTYWNHENSYCREPGSFDSADEGDGTFSQFNTGATVKATWASSDFTLVEMDDPIPSEANPYFCGWDVSNNLPSRAITIHHPDLEEKRISFKYSSLYLGAWGSESTPIPNGNHFIVDDWDLGSTSDGSSGAPLLNRQGLAIGQLHGGLASCSNSEYDAFGRLFSSWTGGGSSENRLKDWLDPDNLGVLVLEGRDCNFNIELSDNNFIKCNTDGFFTIDITLSEAFQTTADLTIQGLPYGLNAFYDQASISPGQTATLIVTNIQKLSTGSYQLLIVAKGQSQEASVPLNFSILEGPSSIPNLVFPEDRSIIDINDARLIWVTDLSAQASTLQLAADPGFDEILLEQRMTTNSFNLSSLLEENRVYFYRVKSSNLCGESEWSEGYQFLAVEMTCTENENAEVYEILDQQPSLITSSIVNETAGSVVYVRVRNVKGEHSFVSDLRFSLVSPEGTEVKLLSNQCSFSKGFDLGFADDGVANIVCPITDRVEYQPEQALSAFRGESAIGEWTLKVEDTNAFDGGNLQSWSLELCIDPNNEYSILTEQNAFNICTKDSRSISLELSSGFMERPDLYFDVNNPSIGVVNQIDGNYHLLLNENNDVLPGNYLVIVNLRDAFGNKASTTFDIIITDEPQDFELLSPGEMDILMKDDMRFAWSNADFAKNYIIVFALDEDFENEIFRDTITDSNYIPSILFEEDTNYYWQIIASNACGENISEVRRFMLEEVNSIQNTQDNYLNVYPNPTDEFVYIQNLNTANSDVDIKIQSAEGKLILNFSMRPEETLRTITVQDWPAGVYFLTAKTLGQFQVDRIVVQ